MIDVKNFKIKIVIIGLMVLLLIPLVSAHAVEKGPISKVTENYNILFSTEPKFPVTGKDTHLDFIIRDKNNNFVNNLNVDLELHKEGKIINLNARESELGHYDLSHKFKEGGEYEVHLSINGNELPIEFNLNIDSFGIKGIIQVSVLLFFALILIYLAYRDCKKNIFQIIDEKKQQTN